MVLKVEGSVMKQQISVIIMGLFVLGQCFAQADAVEENITTKVQTAFPELVVDTVAQSPVSGLYQLTSGPEVLYASNDGRYLLTGDVIDLELAQDDRNITEGARRRARVPMLKNIQANQMILYKPKETKAIVTIFTDTECGYCRKLHREIPKLLDLGIELHYMAYPRQGIGSPTYNKMVSAWCAKDPKAAMERAMGGAEIKPMTCQHSIDEQMRLGRRFGVSGTPTLIFEDGTLWGGYLPPEKLAREAIKHTLKE